jgi:hypothetical protein
MKPAPYHAAVILLFCAFVSGSAGAACFLPAAAQSSISHCHQPARHQESPQPANYKCCASGRLPALITGVFSPRPAVLIQRVTGNLPVEEANWLCDALTLAVSSSSPPGILPLRI